MTAQDNFALILLGVIGVLFIATIFANWLQKRYSPDGKNYAVENFVVQTQSWWYMVLVFALAVFLEPIGIIILSALLSFGALREFLTYTMKNRADHRALVLVYYVILPVQYVLVYFGYYELFSIFIPVYAFFLLAITQVAQGDTHNYLARVSQVQWAIMLCIYSVSYVAALNGLDIDGYQGRSFLLIVYLLLVVQSSEVMQYLFSRWMKGEKLARRLMPSRTWPGVVSGIGSATLLGGLLWWMTPFSLFESLFLSLILSVLGLLGTLVMRGIKRDRGIREWGHIIAGHGGVVDRLDTVMFTAPIFYHIVRYFWAG